LVWIDKYLGRTPNMKLKILRNIYEVVMWINITIWGRNVRARWELERNWHRSKEVL
jgi:hypothetical protein